MTSGLASHLTSHLATVIKKPPRISTSRDPQHIICGYEPVGAWCTSLCGCLYGGWSCRSRIVHSYTTRVYNVERRSPRVNSSSGGDLADLGTAVTRRRRRRRRRRPGRENDEQDAHIAPQNRIVDWGSARARLPQPRHDGPPKCATTMRTGVRCARWRHDEDAVDGVGNIVVITIFITIITPSPDLLLPSILLRYGIISLSSYQFIWLDVRAAAGRLGGVARLI